ncbi:MAG: ester cyclase [Bacteroidetes bacterium]|nr:ester cyclase [Bacteroidota bacterium]
MQTYRGILSVILLVVTIVFVSSVTAQSDKNKEIVIRMIDAINDRNYDFLDDLIAPDMVRHSQATPNLNIRSLDEFRAFLKEDLKTFPDSYITTEMLIAEGDKVAGYFTYTGTQKGAMGPFPPTNKKAELKYLGILRIENGKIAEMWVEWDNLSFLTQLGHFPTPKKKEE